MSIYTKHSAKDCEVCAAQQEADAVGAIPTAGHAHTSRPVLNSETLKAMKEQSVRACEANDFFTTVRSEHLVALIAEVERQAREIEQLDEDNECLRDEGESLRKELGGVYARALQERPMGVMFQEEAEYIVVDRHRRCYAWFRNEQQHGNWLGYAYEAEPERIAKEFDVIVKEVEDVP